MDGLAKITGRLYREIEVGGKVWKLTPPRLRDFAQLEAEVLSKYYDPVARAARVASHVPAEQVGRFWAEAFAASAQAHKYEGDVLQLLPQHLQAAGMAYLVLQRHHSAEIDSLDAGLLWLEQAFESHGESLGSLLAAGVSEVAANPTVATAQPSDSA